MSTSTDSTSKLVKSPVILTKPPPVPKTRPPPPKVSSTHLTTPSALTNVNSHPLKLSNSRSNSVNNTGGNDDNDNPLHHAKDVSSASQPHLLSSSPVALHPLTKSSTENSSIPMADNTVPKYQQFGLLLLGPNQNKASQLITDSSPLIQSSNASKTDSRETAGNDAPNAILTTQQRHILASILVTMLSNSKNIKIPNQSAHRKSSMSSSSDTDPDAAEEPQLTEMQTLNADKDGMDTALDAVDENQQNDDNHEQEQNHNENSNVNATVNSNANHTEDLPSLLNRPSSSPEPDFVDKALGSLQESKQGETDKKSLAKIVSSQKEKLVLLASIIKYMDSNAEMDTIHKACFNLWKDWYRCYGTINNQFQQAFMAVCEKLLGNVDSRALAREPPTEGKNDETSTGDSSSPDTTSIEQITYDISQQILKMKHAFAIEQLQSSSKSGPNNAQNVSQIIDAMESNVWRIVQHIVFEYLDSKYWALCRHALFNLYLNQYESIGRKLDREFVSSSSFGVYTLICQLCGILDQLNQNQQTLKSNEPDEKPQQNGIVDKIQESNDTQQQPPNDDKLDAQSSTDSNQRNLEMKEEEFSNEQYLHGLQWYYAVCRLESILTNKRQDHLNHELYNLYKPIIHPLFDYLDSEHKDHALIQSLVDEQDYQSLQTKYEELKQAPPANKEKKGKMDFVSLLSRISNSCVAWICKDLYYNYRTSEFCILLTQLLADPSTFRLQKEDSRTIRIIRLHKRFNLPKDQPMVDSFSCALDSGKFLHQGKIYFFKDYLCFYSNMLGIRNTQQKFLLPVTEIKSIERKVTAWVFNNAIEIKMKDGRNFIFRTFLNRDATFELLEKLMSGNIDWDEVEKQQIAELEKEREQQREQEPDNNNNTGSNAKDGTSNTDNNNTANNANSGNNNNNNANINSSTSASDLDLKKTRSATTMLGSTLKTALSAIDVSSSKLLSTDAKLLLQSKNKRSNYHQSQSTRSSSNLASTGTFDQYMSATPSIKGVSSLKLEENTPGSVSANALPECVEMKDMKKGSQAVYSAGPAYPFKPTALTATRSAPSSPMFRNGKHKGSNGSISDSETQINPHLTDLSESPETDSDEEQRDTDDDRHISDDDDDDDSDEDAVNEPVRRGGMDRDDGDEEEEEKEEKEDRPSETMMEEGTDEVKYAEDMKRKKPSLAVPTETKEELEAKCGKLNTVHCKWAYTENAKVEKDMELMVEHEFKNIGVDEFWDKFWSNDAVFSPIDWIMADPLNSNVEATAWKLDPTSTSNGEEWYSRNVSCVTKLEDLPAWAPKSISSAPSDTLFKYCKMSDHFYVVHKVLNVLDVPFADCYAAHQKIEFTQKAEVIVDDNEKPVLSLSTVARFNFGVEWKKSTWFKSQIRSRTLLGMKTDLVKYCSTIDERIEQLSKADEEPANGAVAKSKKSGKKKKRRSRIPSKPKPKTKVSLPVSSAAASTLPPVATQAIAAIDTDDDYDIVFKLGNTNSRIRFRLLLSCFTKSRHSTNNADSGWSTWFIVLFLILAVCVLLFCLYVFGTVITLISSMLTVLTSSAEYMHQMSHMQYPQHLYSPPFVPPFTPPLQQQQEHYDPMEHINQYATEKESDEHTETNTQLEDDTNRDKHCMELLDVMANNPSMEILQQTYESLNCDALQRQ